jgi:putative DNA primase/helicase
MVPKVEIPAAVLDASRTESTFSETSAATDADQMDTVTPTNPITEPGSSEETVISGTKELSMEATPAPNAAQEQDKEHTPFAEAEHLPATDDEGSRQAQVIKQGKGAASANRRDRNKKGEAKMSRERVENMATAAARGVTQPDFWAFGGQGPAEETHAQFVYPHTDLGNAQMFYRLFNKFFMYDRESGQWIGWDDNRRRWISGSLARQVMSRLVQKLITKLYRHAQSRRPLRTRNGETVTPEEALNWAKATSEKGRQKAILDQVRDFPVPGVKVSRAELDSDPYLLGVANGVLDLRTGTLIENRPELRITRYARAAYRPDAEAPIFQGFIRQICLDRQDLVDYLQEVFGYALSGLIKEHAFFLLLGTGANGKSTLVETFLYLLSDYSIGMPGHAFLKSNSRAIRNDIARLLGIRYATSAEINSDTSADESTLKRLSSGDVMTARFIGKEYFDFHPQAKFFLSVNTLPKITGADNGIYRRLVVIPFDGDFQATMDRDLPEKLQAEIDGILAWAVVGFQRWHKRGHLVQPDCVVEACKAYRAEMDTVQSFLDECCILDPKASTSLGVLYEAYLQWGKGLLTEPAKKHLFSALMGQKGFKKVKSGDWRWKGVTLKAASPAAETSVFGVPAAPATTGLTQ